MADSKDYSVDLAYWDAADKMDRKYGKNVVSASDTLREAFAQQMSITYEAGYQRGLDQAHAIVHEVVYKQIQEELQKNPKMTLKAFSKKYGFEGS